MGSFGDGFSHVFVGIDCDNIGSSGLTSIGELGSKCKMLMVAEFGLFGAR